MECDTDFQDKLAPPKLLQKIRQHVKENEKFFSTEFFPPKTFHGGTNLCGILYRLYESQTIPLFVDITWKPSAEPLSDSCTEPTSLLMCAASRQVNRFNTMIHIPYLGTTKAQVFEHLLKAKELGVSGIRALRKGLEKDTAASEDNKDSFSSVEDLVTFVRTEFGNFFTIAITGYLCESRDKSVYDGDLGKLKQEVDAGADFITTQMFFEADSFFKFVEDCRNIGIQVPIIPGILPIQNLSSLRQLKKSSSVNIPQYIFDALLPVKDDPPGIIDVGVKFITDLCLKLLAHPEVPGVHFYTLNVEKPFKKVLGNLNMAKNVDDTVMFPWQQNDIRCTDDVRPIFWATRPRSYLIRTSDWEDLPNGRWGSSGAASFGDLKDYHLFLIGKQRNKDELLSMWGRELTSVGDVANIFVCYLTGDDNKDGYKVTELPWSEGELANETIPMVDELSKINKQGILTINSQPCVNAASSEDPQFGWGKPGGYVFQKAYIEFFANEKIANELHNQLQDSKRINFHIVNCSGEDDITNANMFSPIAVTWGVFPGSEVIQPTVVDPIAFQFWKDEAFSLWKQQWGRLYPEGSPSRGVIDSIHDNYYLINLVDNDYVIGNSLFQIINNVIEIVNENNENV